MVDVSRDWAVACDVQQGFMRGVGRPVSSLDYSARCRQALELGGDFYDSVPTEDNRVAVAIADASGRGLAAALMVSNVQSSIRTAALFTGNDPATVMAAVNRQVHASSLADRYATLFYGVFDTASSVLRYVNAGHNPPLVIRGNGSIEWLEAGGAPVGVFADWNYLEGTIHLQPGDMMVACTDGLTEAVNPAGLEWGLEGLRRALANNVARCADDVIEAIFTCMDEFSQGRQTDDATALFLRVL